MNVLKSWQKSLILILGLPVYVVMVGERHIPVMYWCHTGVGFFTL